MGGGYSPRGSSRGPLDMVNEDFTVKLQMRINSGPGRSMVGLATDMGVNERTIRK